MKVILINGSPHARGSTYTALHECELALQERGIDTEIIHIGAKPIAGCMGCWQCRGGHGRCVREDVVNETAEKLAAADGMIFGSPVYYASPNATLLAFLDRLYASASPKLMYKPCGCIVAARRAGTTASLDALSKYPLINEQPLISGQYWCMVHGNSPEEVYMDKEGVEIARSLGRNMAWMVKLVALGREHGLEKP